MSMDAIKNLTEIEQKSAQQRDAVVAQGRQMLADAQKAGRKLVDTSRIAAETEAKAMVAEAEAKAAGITAEILAQAKTNCDGMQQAARQRLDEAATHIAERVVSI